MPKYEKGSQEMKDYMARIRAMRKPKQPKEDAEPKPKRAGRFVRDSQEAKDFMAMIRAKKKKK